MTYQHAHEIVPTTQLLADDRVNRPLETSERNHTSDIQYRSGYSGDWNRVDDVRIDEMELRRSMHKNIDGARPSRLRHGYFELVARCIAVYPVHVGSAAMADDAVECQRC